MVDGSTYQEALANAEQIIREWVETASALGRAIPAPRGWPKEDVPALRKPPTSRLRAFV